MRARRRQINRYLFAAIGFSPFILAAIFAEVGILPFILLLIGFISSVVAAVLIIFSVKRGDVEVDEQIEQPEEPVSKRKVIVLGSTRFCDECGREIGGEPYLPGRSSESNCDCYDDWDDWLLSQDTCNHNWIDSSFERVECTRCGLIISKNRLARMEEEE